MPGTPPTRRNCGAMTEHHRLLRENPLYIAARSVIENRARARQRDRFRVARVGITRVPVVVHVVWNTDEQNISDAQVQSQVDVLNEDYRMRNADTGQVPAVWQRIAADARIEFVLATSDPDGNPTDGITRTQTDVESFRQEGNPVKFAARGGADAWPADRYLNIWVCQLADDLLGYAQFPGGPADTDGVVILHSAFGTTGTAAEPFDKGRTATHEIGHWLNLYHIWGDDDMGCDGSDEVTDTPNCAGPNQGCPTFPHVTCDNGPDGDMFMNYMDYTDDACMCMFTAEQVARMQATLDGSRVLIESELYLVLLHFGYELGGWRVEQHPRFLADLTGSGWADIIGFGGAGVYTALGNGDGTFQEPQLVLSHFGYEPEGGDWRVEQHPRFLADLTGSGHADIVGFGGAGVYTAVGNGDGTFQEPQLVLSNFGYEPEGGDWRVERHPRFLADLTGTGWADIVGFGGAGVYVALGNGDGTFQEPQLVLPNFGYEPEGGDWRVERHPRFLADLTGSGHADIVGFGGAGVHTALGNGDGTFQEPQLVQSNFGYEGKGWRVEQHPRFLGDLTGSGWADIVGFGDVGVWIALSNGDGTFSPTQFGAGTSRLGPTVTSEADEPVAG